MTAVRIAVPGKGRRRTLGLRSGIWKKAGAKRTIPRATLTGHLRQRGAGARSYRAQRWSWGFGWGIRVPKPSSTFSNQGGQDARGCSTRGAGLPRARQLGGAKTRGGHGGARVRVGRGKYSPTPYFCLLVGIQRAMATTSPRGASGCSYSCSERCCSARTLPPCSGKTWATLARPAASPPRRPAWLAPGVPHARAVRSPARPRSPAGAGGRTAPRALPGAAPAPPAGRALCSPAARPPASPADSASPSPSLRRELANGSSRGRLCGPQRSQPAPPRAEEEGEEELVRVSGCLRTLSKYLLNE